MGLENQVARQYNIGKFKIYSNDGKNSVDLTTGEGYFLNLQYNESILENQVSATVTIADIGYAVRDSQNQKYLGLIDGLDMCGGERVELVIEDGYKNKLEFIDEKCLYVAKIRNKLEDTQKMVFVIDLVTKEFFMNELVETRVDGPFDGKISVSVENILKQYLRTEKDVDIEETDNVYSFNGHVEKPFYKCTWLGKRSVPKDGTSKSAGFFFYENYDGFKFKSIESLLDSERIQYKKYVFTNTTELPDEYDGKILEYMPIINIDVQQKMSIGAYGSQVKTYNFYDNEYKEKNIGSQKEGEKGINLAGNNLPCLPEEMFDKPTRIIGKMQPIGVKQNLDKDKSKEKDYNVDEIVAQAASRYNQLFTIVLTAKIAGDFSHRVGDIIFCDFPEQSPGKTQVVSGKNSGIYMIANLAQQVDAREGCWTQFTLVRDSYGRKPFKR